MENVFNGARPGMLISGALAVLGGLAWIAKIALIWSNGGTETTGGMVGFLFLSGSLSLAVAGILRAWFLAGTRKVWWRILASTASVILLILLVDLPILVGWQIFGTAWIAEELGVILVAVLALGFGAQWIASAAPAKPSGT